MSMLSHPDYPQEMAYLQGVTAHLKTEIPKIVKQKEDLDNRVSYAFAHMNIDNPEQFSELTVSLSLLDGWKMLARQMEYALKKPYFARMDFSGATHYIGKMTLMRGLEILITDWRAPLATLYYEGRIGEASYDCPDGNIEGILSLKRQYQIEDGKSVLDLFKVCEEKSGATIPEANYKNLYSLFNSRPVRLETPLTDSGTLHVCRVVLGG